MSTILEDPVLGKRKSIGPCDKFSAKGEAILVAKDEALGEKKDATLDEKEKEGDPCVGVGDEEDSDDGEFLDKKVFTTLIPKEEKDDPCVAVGDDDDNWKEFWCEIAEHNDKVLKEVPPAERYRKYLERPCPICLVPGHFTCPWDRGTCATAVPVVSSYDRVVCKRCSSTDFKRYGKVEFLSCKKCGCDILCAVKLSCPWCMRTGNSSNESDKCDFYGETGLRRKILSSKIM